MSIWTLITCRSRNQLRHV